MAPYAIVFAQSRFWYLSPDPLLVGTYGVSLKFGLTKHIETAGRENMGAKAFGW